LSSQCGSGVLVAEDGTLQALWLTYLGEDDETTDDDIEYYYGLATPTFLPVIQQIRENIIPQLQILNVEFSTIQMKQARDMKVTEEWIRKVALDNSACHQLFMVRKRSCDDSSTLLEGDVILTLNGKIITRVSELDVMYNHKVLDALIVRDCVEMAIQVPTDSADDPETDRTVLFCGAVLHKPHLAVRQQSSKLHSEVYVSSTKSGSPACQYGLDVMYFITAVNGVSTPDLDTFVKEVIKIPDNTCKLISTWFIYLAYLQH
jgi:hypothetical protein